LNTHALLMVRLLKPNTYSNVTGTYDLGVAMAAASCIHPSHREFGVTSGRPRVVGFFDCVAHAELMQVGETNKTIVIISVRIVFSLVIPILPKL